MKPFTKEDLNEAYRILCELGETPPDSEGKIILCNHLIPLNLCPEPECKRLCDLLSSDQAKINSSDRAR